ncbi:hypothetical protein DL96DRAFT_397466 [Flagelloscypha sp. PMI_526]|nr:hypothetical protein DL96DRAFT_397466 [Flagelloscypha sp. PMI_526]
MSAPGPTVDAGAAPDDKFFGIPRYQPFTGGRTFDYEQKYPPDPSGKEASPEARVWLTYLDEAEMYDHDMIQGFRDTIDSLLVLAGLFSAIVATFVAQTSQSLKPDFAQLNLLVQIEQTALLRTGGNISAMDAVPVSNITTQTPTYTTADVWINGLFFTSLSLSIATALLAVLVKQWCQAYTSVTSGSARDKVLTRQFRFDGLNKWRLPEIVGSLPLLLHLAFAVFFAGLSYFVYDLHKTLSAVVIVCAILAEFLYFGSILLPAIWLECPYRIPLLFRPARSLIYFLGKLYGLLGSKGSYILPILDQYLPSLDPKSKNTTIFVSLKQAEAYLLGGYLYTPNDVLSQSMQTMARSLTWLLTLSSNMATQRVVTAAVYGCVLDFWHWRADILEFHMSYSHVAPSLLKFLHATPWHRMVNIAFENTFDQADNLAPSRSSSKSYAGLLEILFRCSSTSNRPLLPDNSGEVLFPDISSGSSQSNLSIGSFRSAISSGSLQTPFPQYLLDSGLMSLLSKDTGRTNLRESLLRWGANIQYHNNYEGGFLHAAIGANNMENVRWLIEHNAPINEPLVGIYGTTLMSACYHGFVDAVKLLIEKGADVNRFFEGHEFLTGCTPLTHSIAGQWKLEIGEMLLDNGARINEPFSWYWKPSNALQLAVEKGNPGAVRFLLERGAALTPQIKDTLHRVYYTFGSHEDTAEIEGILREYASRTIKSHCLPKYRLGPVLSRDVLA